jgi:hypothetical protein
MRSISASLLMLLTAYSHSETVFTEEDIKEAYEEGYDEGVEAGQNNQVSVNVSKDVMSSDISLNSDGYDWMILTSLDKKDFSRTKP